MLVLEKIPVPLPLELPMAPLPTLEQKLPIHLPTLLLSLLLILLEALRTLPRPLAGQPRPQRLLPTLPSQPPRSDHHKEDETDPLLQIEEQLLQVMNPPLVNQMPQQLPPSPLLALKIPSKPEAARPQLLLSTKTSSTIDHHKEDETDPLLRIEEQLLQAGSPLLVNPMPQQLLASPRPALPMPLSLATTPSKPDKSILAVVRATPRSVSLPFRPPALPTPRQWTISLL